MARVLSTAFCVALLGATALAFALTERAKTERSPIYGTKLTPQHTFSPTCNPRICHNMNVVDIDFKLRKKQHVKVWMEHNGKLASTIVAGKTFAKGEVELVFTGIADDGVSILPDGSYEPVIRLGAHKTITLPNKIELDTTPPKVVKFEKQIYKKISPNGDGRNDRFVEAYTLDGPAHAVLIVNGHKAEFTRGLKSSGKLTWAGVINKHHVRAGRYVLYIAAQDGAGNRSKPFPFAVITVRYIELGRTTIDVAPRHKFALGVHTDAKQITYLFDRGHGESRSHTLRLRAPRKPGHYELYVTAAGHTAKATVVVG